MKSVTLGDVSRIERTLIQPGNIADGTTYVGLENIASGGTFVNVEEVAKGDLASNKFHFGDAHILYGKLRPYLAKIALPDFAGICSTDILPIRVGEKVDRRYIAYFLRQQHIVDEVNRRSSGANLPRINAHALESLAVPCPPLTDQRRIAEILDRVERLRAKRRQAIVLLDSLGNSIYNALFGDSIVDADRWPIVSVADVCSRIVDCVNRTAPVSSVPTPYKMIRTTNVRNRIIDLSGARSVDEETFQRWNRRLAPRYGDVVLTREAPMGEAGIVPAGERVFLGQRTMLYRANPLRITPEYLLYTLTSRYLNREFLKNGTGSTVRHLSVPYCRSFPVPLPPVEIQREFSSRIAVLERLKMKHAQQLAELDNLFLSLQDRAFKGEL